MMVKWTMNTCRNYSVDTVVKLQMLCGTMYLSKLKQASLRMNRWGKSFLQDGNGPLMNGPWVCAVIITMEMSYFCLHYAVYFTAML